MKLELKHLAPYSLYGLKVKLFNNIDIITGIDFENGIIETMSNNNCLTKNLKPILIPLSDYTEGYANFWNYSFRDFKWAIINKEVSVLCWHDLLSKHYDVFGLIEKGLAIDINTL